MPIDLARDVVLRWDAPEPAHIPLFRQAGVTAVLAPAVDSASAQACKAAGVAVVDPSAVQLLAVDALRSAKPGVSVALTDGLWPGITRPPSVADRGDETASASVEPWIDANGFWIGYLRALYPNRAAVLGYTAGNLGDRSVPFDSLELALIEAWTAGGNYLLSVEPRYRAALLRHDARAVAAWTQLGRTAGWLRENVVLFRQPTVPIVTALVEPGEETAELANLMYRRNVSPQLCSAAALPPPDPQTRLALVAANLKPPAPEQAKRIMAHAQAGGTVVVAAPPADTWWRKGALKLVRREADREFLSTGKGQVVAYKGPVEDPNEFALDVIDIISHRRRAVRLWNAPAMIALATESPRRGERLLHVINYGSPVDVDVQARVQGQFTKAMLLRPEASAVSLTPAKRGSTTEVFLPEIRRLAVVVFS